MERVNIFAPQTLARDFTAGIVVFLVALPLCLGIALASGAPLFSGLLAGIVGGIVIGAFSGSHTSVSGPAAGLTAIVATQIGALGSFEAFLLAVVVGGVIQIGLGLAKAGFLAAFFPTSVIKGLLAAIGIILILKQLPYVLGHQSFEPGPEHRELEGDLSYNQPGHENPFLSLLELLEGEYHYGPLLIGLFSIAFLVSWDKIKTLKTSLVPAPLLVVLMGVGGTLIFNRVGGIWGVGEEQHVQVPVAESIGEFVGFLTLPDFAQLLSFAGVWAIMGAGLTIAVVASLETLLNCEAVDNLDPKKRSTPANRELLAQGIGNVTCGLIGGLPVTSVVVRGSVSVGAGAQTKLSAMVHGWLLLGFVMLLPQYLNMIPLSCLAAILMVTGFKLASPKLMRQMWHEGKSQFLPFIITVIAIVMTDLLIGILIGLGVALAFILYSNYRRSIHRVSEKHICGEILRIELPNQVSFLNRPALERVLRSVPEGGHVLLDATHTDYIDPDVLHLIRDFKDNVSQLQGCHVSLRGFRSEYKLEDQIQFVDFTTRELQRDLTPAKVVTLLKEGNERFRKDQRLARDWRQARETANGQFPMAVIVSCMDSRLSTETIFDLGIGDVLNICLAGNSIDGTNAIASAEYGCAISGTRLILVLGHTNSSVIRAIVEASTCTDEEVADRWGTHFKNVVENIRPSIDEEIAQRFDELSAEEQEQFVDEVSLKHVKRSIMLLMEESDTIRLLVDSAKLGIAGAMYDLRDGRITFPPECTIGFKLPTLPQTVDHRPQELYASPYDTVESA